MSILTSVYCLRPSVFRQHCYSSCHQQLAGLVHSVQNGIQLLEALQLENSVIKCGHEVKRNATFFQPADLAPDDMMSPYRLLLCRLQKAEDILTPEGVMEVWLLEAENVPKMDFFGSGQPYGK